MARGDRVCALTGWRSAANAVEILAVLAADESGQLRLALGELEGDAFPSLTPECPQVHLFERELAETLGLSRSAIPGSSPCASGRTRSAIGVIDFYRVEGDEVHEVAVGPVHAGVIEPGHFRFQCHGEEVLHLEISLGYQHRGVERALVEGDPRRRIHYAETLAGDTSVGHALAYCAGARGARGLRARRRARTRCAASRSSWSVSRTTPAISARWPATWASCRPRRSAGGCAATGSTSPRELCGSRFGRSLVRPGGVGFDLEPERVERMRDARGRGAARRRSRRRAALDDAPR